MTGAVQSGMIANTMLPAEQGDPITASLDFVREHLGMEVAYLSEFIDDALVFRAVSAPGLEELVQVGGSMPLDQVYCKHILSGDLPQLIPDTANEPLCQKIPLTPQPQIARLPEPARSVRHTSLCPHFCRSYQ